ncbi:MAG: hypothetical protein J07AB43_17050 [Candidatus Nanosalina sp. J07AB43]|jgi:hypothetical protein|nr:MAG: hypothetical protein J07AB43_17050 [Candidatus Nanosalina sp. J07AB43]
MAIYAIYDFDEGEEVLPEQSHKRYSNVVEAIDAYNEEFDDLDKLYDDSESIKVAEFDIHEGTEVGWVAIEPLPSRGEIWDDVRSEDSQDLRDDL